jgi:hypothetical protein
VFEIPARRPDRYAASSAAENQRRDGFTGPQRERQKQLIGATVANRANHLAFAGRVHAQPRLGTAFARGKNLHPAGFHLFDPACHRLTADAERPGGLSGGHSVLEDGVDHAATKVFLGIWRKPTSIHAFHATSDTRWPQRLNK